MSCPQIWNIEKDKDGEKQKVGRQVSEAQRGKELERERKSKGNIFCWRNNMKFCSSGEKMRNVCFHQGEMSDVKNKQEHVQHFLHVTGNQKVSGSFTL